MSHATRPAILLVIVAGYTIWSIVLVVLYAALSVGCDLGWQDQPLGPTSLQRAMLLALWIAGVAGLILLARLTWVWWRKADQSRSRLVRFNLWLAAFANIAAGAATLLMGLPILALSPCT